MTTAAGECLMQKELERYIELVQSYVKGNYKKCFREPHGKFKYPCVVPGSSYSAQLWDWDSWLTDIALAAAAEGDDIAGKHTQTVSCATRAICGKKKRK